MLYIILFCVILIIIYYVVGNYFYNIALNPKKDKSFLFKNKEFTEEQIQQVMSGKKWVQDNSKDVYIYSTNNGNLKLHAYEIKSKTNSDVWVIAVHGYISQGNEMMWIAKPFYEAGFNLLIPDLRGHGLSEGKYIGMGWHDRLDLIDWINFIIKKSPESKIILFGVSMGAATVMMATGETLPNNVKLAICDCGYSSAWDEFKYKLKQIFKLPSFPFLNIANTFCKKRAGYSIKDASSIRKLEKSKTPTLFIHGSEDKFVPFNMLDIVYNSAACEKEKLVVEGAKHGASASVAPELYKETIEKFINKYL